MTVAFDAITSAKTAGTGWTQSHTPVAGSGLSALVVVEFASNPGAVSFTYAGVSMALVGARDNGGPYAKIFFLAGVSAGAQNAIGSWANSVAFYGHVYTFTGAARAEDYTSNTGVSSLTVPNVSAIDMVVDSWMQTTNTPTVGADQTERYSDDSGWGGFHYRGSTQPGSAGGVMSWSQTGEVMQACRLVAVSAGNQVIMVM